MVVPIASQGFNYGRLSPAIAKWLAEKTAAVRFTARRSAEETIRIGMFFAEVRQRIGHGCWLDWIDTEFAYSPTQARRLIKVAKVFAENMSQIGQFDPSALYVLTQSNTPDEARVLALQCVARGERVTHRKALEILDACKSPPVTRADLDDVARSRRAIPGLELKPVAEVVRHPGYESLVAVVDASSSVRIERFEDSDTNDYLYAVMVHGDDGPRDTVGPVLSEVLQQVAGTEPKKLCLKCNQNKGLFSMFSLNRTKADGRATACKKCEIKRSKTAKGRKLESVA